jgi:hypothetical protein
MFHLLKNYIIITQLANFFSMYNYVHFGGARGGAVVEALSYKLEGHGINSRWCQNFLLT